MCIPTGTYYSPRETVALSFQSFDFLPAPPRGGKFTSETTEKAVMRNLDGLCIPFPLMNGPETRLVLEPSIDCKRRRMVRRALHRMSNKAVAPAAPEAVAPAPTATVSPEDDVLTERMSRLMKNQKRSESSKASSAGKMGGGDMGAVPLVRGVKRASSGAALCA